MVKLVVEEGGKRRAFKLGDGVLTVGSGADAKLKLSSVDVAEIHIELVVKGSTLTVRPRPGVMPPTVSGEMATVPTEVPAGATVELGGARIWLDNGEGEPAAAAPRASAAASRSASPAPARQTLRAKADQAQEQELRRRRAIDQAGRTESRSTVERTRPRGKKSVPGWLIGGGIFAAAAIVFLLLKSGVEKTSADGAGTTFGSIQAAKEQLAQSNFDSALMKLSKIPEGRTLSPREIQQIDEIKSTITRRRQINSDDLMNRTGTRWKDVYLIKYEGKHLQGSPPVAKVRLFLKRLNEFRRRWPRHPDLDWIGRQERRFSGTADLSLPPDFASVKWEVGRMVGTAPRKYRQAFEELDAFLARSDADNRADAEELRALYVTEREEYHIDRLQQARYEVERKEDYSASIKELVHSVIWLGDETMENEAASILINLDKVPEVDLPGSLEDYNKMNPDKYAALWRNPIVAEFARANDMIKP